MAVQLEFINILVPFSAIERVHQGGAEGFRKEYEGHPGVWWDRFLFRCGSMNSIDLILWLEELEKHGLSRFRTYAGKRIAGDIALATIEFGIEDRCPWLTVDRVQGIAWLSGTEPGEIAGPAAPFRNAPV